MAQKELPTSTPMAVDLNADSLARIDAEIASGNFGYIDGMLIIRHGKVAYERSYKHDYSKLYKAEANKRSTLNNNDPTGPYNYFNSWWHPFYRGSDLHSLQSVTKTITSVIIGAAIARKEFPDVNTPVLTFFDTTLIRNIDARKRRITIRHLLTMTAGFDWNESKLSYMDPKNHAMLMEASSDWVSFTINRPMSDEPGTAFNYNSGGAELLAYIFRVATGKDIEKYAAKYLFEPLGIEQFYWKRTPFGLVDSEGGLYLKQSDLAKIFYLYLKNGNWDGRQIIQPEWIKQSVTPSITISPEVKYGYKWWIYPYGSDSTQNSWFGLGFGGQIPFIIPEYDLVVVFTGWNILEGKPTLSSNEALSRILHCINEYNHTGHK